MDTKTEIKVKLVENNITAKTAARLAGLSPQNFSQKLARGTITYEEVKQLAHALGYKLAWIRDTSIFAPAPEQPADTAPRHTAGTH